MNDRFVPTDIAQLYQLIGNERRFRNTVFGIHENLFYKDGTFPHLTYRRYGIDLSTPFGVAAGPQTQLAQNIVTAYLCGARYIELKTVQTLDTLEITKPCIRVDQAGFNCEWSQELSLDRSFAEYLNAWVLLYRLGNARKRDFIFNMSVGYNMEGIMQENVQRFLDRMTDASDDLARMKETFPEMREIDVPACISDNVTISTMHGCPPDEIESIALYFIRERKLHTAVKLNPTLLGPKTLREILNLKLGYEIDVPDIAFEHDLKYDDAVGMLKRLQAVAKDAGVEFGVKLTNTLETSNRRELFSPDEAMVYMSGKPLHPLVVELAYRLQSEFGGGLDVSYSGGADFANVPELLNAGIAPITFCTELLKPGGYARLKQIIQNAADSVPDLRKSVSSADKLENLKRYRDKLGNNDHLRRYQANRYAVPDIKTRRVLSEFDCVSAPCKQTCPDRQDIPSYMRYAAEGNWNSAYACIRDTNPFPNVTGAVCDHQCTAKCTRINYDMALDIRGVKLAAAMNATNIEEIQKLPFNGKKVALIGAGPSSLSCAYYLALAGFHTDVYEAKSFPGGMVTDAIPAFRLDEERFRRDLENILAVGVAVHYDQTVDRKRFETFKKDYDHIYIGVGAQIAKKMGVPGEDAPGVLNALDFLSRCRRGDRPGIGKTVAVIGGGNSAMDAAREAKRHADEVYVLYRRTRAQMPASQEEIEDSLAEGIVIRELTQPVDIRSSEGKLQIRCVRMELGAPDDSGRRRPVPVDGSEFEIGFDTVISAIGQDTDLSFMDIAETEQLNIHIGGDAERGAANIISAIADGRETAERIAAQYEIDVPYRAEKRPMMSLSEQQERSATCRPVDARTDSMRREADACLDCDSICNVCVSVCPNRANLFGQVEPVSYRIADIRIDGENTGVDYTGRFDVVQSYQTFNIADWCNHCGNCETFCPTSGAPYRDKPRICLSAESFDVEENAYLISTQNGKFTLIAKLNGNFTARLWYDEDGYIYVNDVFSAKFDPETLELRILTLSRDSGVQTAINTEHVAKMAVIHTALRNLFYPEEK